MAENDSETAPKNSLFQWGVAVLLVSIISAIVGWFLGQHVSNSNEGSAEIIETKPSHEKTKNNVEYVSQLPQIVKLPSLLVNIAHPASKRIRLDVSLVLKEGEKLPADISAHITSDFLLFLRTATLEQLKGPTGIFYLRQDLLDRARIRSNGKVIGILITSLILE